MERAKVTQMQGLSKKLNNTICFYTPQLRRKKLTVTDDINETHEETRNGNYFYYWLRWLRVSFHFCRIKKNDKEIKKSRGD